MNICLVWFHRALEIVCQYYLLISATLLFQETMNKWCNQNYKLGFLTSSHKFQPQNLILLFKVLLQETRLTPKAKLWGLSKLVGMIFFFFPELWLCHLLYFPCCTKLVFMTKKIKFWQRNRVFYDDLIF